MQLSLLKSVSFVAEYIINKTSTNFNVSCIQCASRQKNLPAMKANYKLYIAACTLALLSACGNNSTSTESAISAVALTGSPLGNAPATQILAVDAYTPPASSQQSVSPMKARNMRAAPPATHIALGAPLASMAAKANANAGAGKPFQIGFSRDVAQTATATATGQVLQWHTTEAGGQVAAINFNSTGAKGMRVGLLVTQLPETATLRFYAKGAATAFEVNGAEVLAVLAKNLAAGDKTDEGRTYWAPAVDGADATIEIEIPAGFAASSVVVSVPGVSHIFMTEKEISTISAQINYGGDANAGLSCQVDIKCSSPMPAATDAVVHLRFIAGGGSYICSGTMLNDSQNSSVPYLLTANHCISNQTVASTLTTWFKYRSTTCNDGTTGEYYPTTGGADLLYTAYNTDSTLVKLRNPPAVSGVLYAGWDATTTPATTTAVHGVHHPRGDQQRLSRGAVNGYYTRNPDQTLDTSFFGATAATGTILGVNLTTGIVEPGSSGSGLFKGTNSNPQLIGQLFGGKAAACSSSAVSATQSTAYGRFDVAFYSGMSDWLAPGMKPVYRFYNTQKGTHFFTQSAIERDNIIASLPQFNFEGTSFNAYTGLGAGLSAVYRFFNTQTGAHFYTISTVERDNVRNTLPQYSYEGERWYAQTAAGNGTIPLYRFFHKGNGTHFYTINPIERDNIISGLPIYAYEGVAYYVWP